MSLFKQKYAFLLFLTALLAGMLRLIWLERFPPSLYTDETNQGYNAYSVLTTGRDEHGAFLPVSFRSFGDWKPPLPTYLMIPFIKLFGLTETAVRLPSAILGIGLIILSYFLVRELLSEDKDSGIIALLTSFFLAVSPWHILQSRSTMLVVVGLFFLSLSVFFFVRGVKKRYNLIFSAVCFSLSFYSYYALRIIAPLFIVLLFFRYRSAVSKNWKNTVLVGSIGFVLLLPLILSFLKENDVLFGRARTVSVFYDQGIKLKQWELITQDGINSEPILSRFYHNNVYLYGKNIIQRFLSHFDPNYLLLTGDQSQPFQIPNMGIIYVPDLLLFLLGTLILYKKKYQNRNIIIGWLLISFVPASFTFMTPSSNRTFTALLPLTVLTSTGLVFLLRKLKRIKIVPVLTAIFYALSFFYFVKQYFIILPQNHAEFWNYGWKEVIKKTDLLESGYDDVVVADVNGMPYIYFLFYKRYDPRKYQKEAIRTYVADRFGFEHVEGFGKYLFPNDFDWKYEKDRLLNKTLYVVPASQVADEDKVKETIYLPKGTAIFKIISND